jgi:ammonia channel protein AmtB
MTVLIFPVQHAWVWGDGWLARADFIDYSGSGVAYMVGGICGTVGAIFLGPRHGFCQTLTAGEKEIIDRNKKLDRKKKINRVNNLKKQHEVTNKAGGEGDSVFGQTPGG